jgi:hypothetical protein
LLFGQAYTPTFAPVGNQAWGEDLSLLDVGGLYIGRRPMAQLSIAGLKVALLTVHSASDLGKKGDIDITIPKLEVSYLFKTDKFRVEPYAGYQTYSVEKATVPDFDVDSYVFGVQAGVKFGALYVDGNVYMGQNLGPYGTITRGADDPVFVGNTLKDVSTLGYAAAVGFKVSDMLSFEGGFGAVAQDSDVTNAQDDETLTYYIQANISPAKGFNIVPEIGIVDLKDNAAGKPEGKLTYFGAKWQVNF